MSFATLAPAIVVLFALACGQPGASMTDPGHPLGDQDMSAALGSEESDAAYDAQLVLPEILLGEIADTDLEPLRPEEAGFAEHKFLREQGPLWARECATEEIPPGVFTLRLELQADGEVLGATSEPRSSRSPLGRLAGCILRLAKAQRFPAAKTSGQRWLQVPMRFPAVAEQP